MKKFIFLLPLLIVLGLLVDYKPAPKIVIGQSRNEVSANAGRPSDVVNADTFSRSPAGGYQYYSPKSPDNLISAKMLPRIEQEAWFYPYGLANTSCLLIFFDAQGHVTDIFCGST